MTIFEFLPQECRTDI